jgi:excisionase family DNA binding protein
MTVIEIADILRVSRMSVYRWMNNGELGHTRIGRNYRVTRNALDKFLAERSTEGQYNA